MFWGFLGVWERRGGDGFFATARDSCKSNSRYVIVEWSLKSHYYDETLNKGVVDRPMNN